MTREQQLELIITSLCLAGLAVANRPRKTELREELRREVLRARRVLKADLAATDAPIGADPRPEPPPPEDPHLRAAATDQAGPARLRLPYRDD